MKKRKLLKKVLLISLSAFILLVAFLIIFKSTWTNALKNAVVEHAEKMTQSNIEVNDFSLYLMQAKVTIDKLDVGNPKGYNTPTALGFEKLAVDLDLGSVFEDTVVIEEITVNGLHVSFETDLVSNNLNDLKKNINSYMKKEKVAEEKATPEEKAKKGKSKKFIIKKLNIINGKITVAAKFMKGAQVPIKLADIHLTDIGNDSNGVNAGEVAEKLISAIIESATKAIDSSDILSGEIKTKSLKSGAEGVIKSIKGLFK
jgi:uncharacterized protein involved in outer membrane biogenesis